MNTTGIAAIENTIQTFNVWLKEIETSLAWQDREKSYHALRSVLHALRDRLPVEEAAQLSAQLPILIRGIYWEGWRSTRHTIRERRRQDFLDRVQKEMGNDFSIDVEEVVRTVFGVIAHHVSVGEAKDIGGTLPKDLRELWEPALHQ